MKLHVSELNSVTPAAAGNQCKTTIKQSVVMWSMNEDFCLVWLKFMCMCSVYHTAYTRLLLFYCFISYYFLCFFAALLQKETLLLRRNWAKQEKKIFCCNIWKPVMKIKKKWTFYNVHIILHQSSSSTVWKNETEIKFVMFYEKCLGNDNTILISTKMCYKMSNNFTRIILSAQSNHIFYCSHTFPPNTSLL